MYKGLLIAVSSTVILVATALLAYSFARNRPSTITSTPQNRPPTVNTGAETTATATIAQILDDSFIVASGESEMTLSRDPSIVQVYRRNTHGITATTYDYLQVGQRVSVEVIVPGTQVSVYIEE